MSVKQLHSVPCGETAVRDGERALFIELQQLRRRDQIVRLRRLFVDAVTSKAEDATVSRLELGNTEEPRIYTEKVRVAAGKKVDHNKIYRAHRVAAADKRESSIVKELKTVLAHAWLRQLSDVCVLDAMRTVERG